MMTPHPPSPEIRHDTADIRLRRFLLLLADFVLMATVAELILEDHTKEALQFVPFVLCALGLIVVTAALVRPDRLTLMSVRITMAVVAIGGVFGTAIHFKENLEFIRDIRPNAALAEVLVKTLKGAAPLLAPGVLVFAGLLAIIATYHHPALEHRDASESTEGRASVSMSSQKSTGLGD